MLKYVYLKLLVAVAWTVVFRVLLTAKQNLSFNKIMCVIVTLLCTFILDFLDMY